jgi:hypothetical protein
VDREIVIDVLTAQQFIDKLHEVKDGVLTWEVKNSRLMLTVPSSNGPIKYLGPDVMEMDVERYIEFVCIADGIRVIKTGSGLPDFPKTNAIERLTADQFLEKIENSVKWTINDSTPPPLGTELIILTTTGSISHYLGPDPGLTSYTEYLWFVNEVDERKWLYVNYRSEEEIGKELWQSRATFLQNGSQQSSSSRKSERLCDGLYTLTRFTGNSS